MKRNRSSAVRSMVKAKRRKAPAKKESTALQLAKLRNQIRFSAPPTKTVYHSTGQSVGSSFWANGPYLPAKGGDKDERLGEKIQIKSINCRFKVTTSDSDDYDSMRVTIVQYMDNNPTGSAPDNSVTNVFSTEAQTSYPWIAPFNSLKTASYRVLFDELIHVNQNGEAEISRNLMFTPKQLGITKLDFVDDTGGELAGLEEGLVRMLVISDSTAIPNPSIEVVWRLNFTDT